MMGDIDAMSETDCIICKIVAGELPSATVLETAQVVAFMDLLQPQPGHLLVGPRAHHPRLAELPPELGVAMMQAAQRLSHALYRSLAPAGLNLLLADGTAAGQELMHVHLHLLPRAAGDGVLRIRAGTPSPPEHLAALAERIRARVDG